MSIPKLPTCRVTKCLSGMWLRTVGLWSITSTSLEERSFPVSRRGEQLSLNFSFFFSIGRFGIYYTDIILVIGFLSSLLLRSGMVLDLAYCPFI